MTNYKSFFSKILLSALLLAGLYTLVMPASQASALSGGDFQAARIMDDGVFFNPNTMSVAQIQEFMNAKVPVCDTNGTQPYGGTTRAQYSATRGYYPPFTCLRDYRTDTVNKSAESSICNGHTAGNKSSAQIIYEVAQSCGVNPKVLLVLLQKEQSLVTDDWPWSTQYRSATGYGCPDTAPCDAEYYGFFNQVYMAARQFKRYAAFPGNYNYRSGRNNFIQFNPNANCGGSTIFIQNNATAGLYNYTPYQPNAAALNNLYGTGDGCSAYGNRNFWRMYNDWFGSTLVGAYAWSVVGQATYTDATKTVSRSTSFMPGQRAYMVVQARNTGNSTWQPGVSGQPPIRIGTSRPLDRRSGFCDSTWLNPDCNRVANLREASVAPGQTGTFEFWITAPSSIGTFNEHFNLVADGVDWMNDPGMYWTMQVSPPVYSWSVVGQSSYVDQTKSTAHNNHYLPGDRSYMVLKAKNTGNVAWTRGGSIPVRVGTHNPMDRRSGFCDSTWLNPDCNRVANLVEQTVNPGETGTFEFWVKAPQSNGVFNEYFSLVADGYSWMNDPGMYWTMHVHRPIYQWSVSQQAAYTDATKTTPHNLNLTTGQRAYIVLKAKNTGNTNWVNTLPNPIRVGTSNPMDRKSIFCDNTWLNPDCNRVANLKESIVGPGQVGTFEFWVTAPNTSGFKNEYFNLVADGITWLNDPGMYWTIRVN